MTLNLILIMIYLMYMDLSKKLIDFWQQKEQKVFLGDCIAIRSKHFEFSCASTNSIWKTLENHGLPILETWSYFGHRHISIRKMGEAILDLFPFFDCE